MCAGLVILKAATHPAVNCGHKAPNHADLLHRGARRGLCHAVGFLRIEQPGDYVFRLISDDGSRLTIGGRRRPRSKKATQDNPIYG